MGKMEIIFGILLCLFYETLCEKNTIKSKNPLPYFRRQVEEVFEETYTQRTLADDMHSNLVSFFIKNVKEIYNEVNEHDQKEASSPMAKVFAVHTSTTSSVSDVISEDTISDDTVEDTKSDDSVQDITDDTVEGTTSSSFDTDLITEISVKTDISFLRIRKLTVSSKITTELNSGSNENAEENDVLVSSTTEFDYGSNENADENDVLVSYKNATLIPFSDKEVINLNPATPVTELDGKEELMHLSKNFILFETDRKVRANELEPVPSFKAAVPDKANSGRSCIYCNNIKLENCNDPKNKLIPSTVCEHDDDYCYSQHTPFGVVDRGCFNVNDNLTIYVCSCNLCNYISISEMPHIYSKKGSWAENVIEISLAKKLKKSVMKHMSCFRCETNKADVDTNCLEGIVGSLATQTCKDNEMCAVKAIRKENYVWRGCLKFPSYNYWWYLCDSDLCNYDTTASIFDNV